MNLNFHENHRLLYGTALAGFVALTVIIAIAPASWVKGQRVEKRGLATSIATDPRNIRQGRISSQLGGGRCRARCPGA